MLDKENKRLAIKVYLEDSLMYMHLKSYYIIIEQITIIIRFSKQNNYTICKIPTEFVIFHLILEKVNAPNDQKLNL